MAILTVFGFFMLVAITVGVTLTAAAISVTLSYGKSNTLTIGWPAILISTLMWVVVLWINPFSISIGM